MEANAIKKKLRECLEGQVYVLSETDKEVIAELKAPAANQKRLERRLNDLFFGKLTLSWSSGILKTIKVRK